MNTYEDILMVRERGDRAAFGRLVERYHGQVFGICRGMTTQHVDAEDLAHEAFVEAFLKMHTLRDPKRFGSWLRTLTLNICRMWHRQRKREQVVVPGDMAVVDDVPQLSDLNGCFAHLSDSHRLILVLHYWEGLAYDEMAQFLGVPIGTVMSRMNRARKVLKEAMKKNEDIDMETDRDFQTEVDAEIDVLLKLFGDEADSMERLSVVLENSPGRFRQVIAQVENGATVDQIALLLRYLGAPAVGVTLACYFEDDADIREKAFALLQRVIGKWDNQQKPEKGFKMPLLPEVNLVLDAIIRSKEPLNVRLELMVDLLESIEVGSAAILFAEVIRGYGVQAFAVLFERFKEIADPKDHKQYDNLLSGLRLFGSQFLEELLTFLKDDDRHQMLLGLRGVEAVVGLLNPHGLDNALPEHRELKQRICGALFSKEMDALILDRVTRAVVKLMHHSDSDIRSWAVGILEQLPVGAHVSDLRDCLHHEDLDTRLAAMKTLASLNDRGCISDIIACARNCQGLEQRRAIEALGQLCASEAQGLMLALIDSEEREIRQAAVLALGNVGNESAREKLKTLTRSSDKRIARTAASALYGGKRANMKMSALQRARLQKIRGEAKPMGVLFRSRVAAIRTLLEIRPYDERDLTRRIAQVCSDYSTTRRALVMDGRRALMKREKGVYTFMPLGEAVWRVERFIQEHFLGLERY